LKGGAGSAYSPAAMTEAKPMANDKLATKGRKAAAKAAKKEKPPKKEKLIAVQPLRKWLPASVTTEQLYLRSPPGGFLRRSFMPPSVLLKIRCPNIFP
jgi:hypothetical protein